MLATTVAAGAARVLRRRRRPGAGTTRADPRGRTPLPPAVTASAHRHYALHVTERLPLFPLDSVLYPGLVLPLHVFEERYRKLVADLLAVPEDAPRRFGVVAIRCGHEVAPTGPAGGEPGPMDGLGPDPERALFDVGCVADVATIRTRPDGRYELVATGTTRFRVVSVDTGGSYLTAEVEPMPEETGPEAGALAAGVARAFRAYQRQLAGAQESTIAAEQELPDDPAVLSYLVAAASMLETADKQRLLAAPDAATRLSEELRLLRRETAVLSRLPSLPATDLSRRATCPN